MSLQAALAFVFTVLTSVCIVAVIILFGWVLIWKAYLSKFRLVRELLGQETDILPQPNETNSGGERLSSQSKSRKSRKE